MCDILLGARDTVLSETDLVAFVEFSGWRGSREEMAVKNRDHHHKGSNRRKTDRRRVSPWKASLRKGCFS